MQRLLRGPAEPQQVTSIEGTPTCGTFFVTPVLSGDRVAMLEISVAQGVSSRMHKHAHESVLYVVSGSLRTVVADQVLTVACRHPENVMHSVEALEDTVFIEIKAPCLNCTQRLASRTDWPRPHLTFDRAWTQS